MKKASEHATQLLENRLVGGELDIKSISTLVHVILSEEVNELVLWRHITRDAGIISVIKEQIQKWKAICRKVNAVQNENGCAYLLNENALREYLKSMGGMEDVLRELGPMKGVSI